MSPRSGCRTGARTQCERRTGEGKQQVAACPGQPAPLTSAGRFWLAPTPPWSKAGFGAKRGTPPAPPPGRQGGVPRLGRELEPFVQLARNRLSDTKPPTPEQV